MRREIGAALRWADMMLDRAIIAAHIALQNLLWRRMQRRIRRASGPRPNAPRPGGPPS